MAQHEKTQTHEPVAAAPAAPAAATAVAEKPRPGYASNGEKLVEVVITTDRPGYIVPRGQRCEVPISRGFRWHHEGFARLTDSKLIEQLEREKREREEALDREIEEEEKQRRR